MLSIPVYSVKQRRLEALSCYPDDAEINENPKQASYSPTKRAKLWNQAFTDFICFSIIGFIMSGRCMKDINIKDKRNIINVIKKAAFLCYSI